MKFIVKMVNCFFLFCLENRSSLFVSNPNLSNAEITSMLGKLWRELPIDKKEYYKQQSELVTTSKKTKENHQKQYIFKFKVNKTTKSPKLSPGKKQNIRLPSMQIPRTSSYIEQPSKTPMLPSIHHLLNFNSDK